MTLQVNNAVSRSFQGQTIQKLLVKKIMIAFWHFIIPTILYIRNSTLIDILMANISVCKWNKTSFSLHGYLPWTHFQKNRTISFIRHAIKRNWYFFNTILSCEFFLFFVQYKIHSPEVNIQLLLLWFLLSPLNYIILKNRSYQWGSCDHSFYRSQWEE